MSGEMRAVLYIFQAYEDKKTLDFFFYTGDLVFIQLYLFIFVYCSPADVIPEVGEITVRNIEKNETIYKNKEKEGINAIHHLQPSMAHKSSRNGN